MTELYRFLDEVRINNNREWFTANRARYDALRASWTDDLNRLIAHMTAWEPGMASQSASTASYRFYRDTRLFGRQVALQDILFGSAESRRAQRPRRHRTICMWGPTRSP